MIESILLILAALIVYIGGMVMLWFSYHRNQHDDFNWRYLASPDWYRSWAGRNRRLGPINQHYYDETNASHR